MRDALPEAGAGYLPRGAGERQEPQPCVGSGDGVNAVVFNIDRSQALSLGELELRSARDALHVDLAVERVRVVRTVG